MNHELSSTLITLWDRCRSLFSLLFWAIFLLALSGLAGITLAGFFGRLHWRLDLLSHFRMQYLFAAVLFLSISLLGRKRWLSLFATFVTFANLIVLFPLLTLTPTAEAGIEPLRIVSANVYYFNNSPEEVVAFIHESDPDILFLAEMTSAHRMSMADLWDSYPYVVDSGRGNILLSRLPIESSAVDYHLQQRPNVLLRTTHEGQPLTIIGAHTHTPMSAAGWQTRNTHLQKLATLVQQEANPVIIVGDFNISPYSPNFTEFLAAGNLKNGRNDQGINTTWPNFIPLLRIPIDHFVATPEISVHQLKSGRYIGSDHRPLITDFSLSRPSE